MEWMADPYATIMRRHVSAVIVGKPIALGGSHHRGKATASGSPTVNDAFMNEHERDPERTTVAIQGFGNAGAELATLLYEAGFKVAAVSDSSGAVYDAGGLDVPALREDKTHDVGKAQGTREYYESKV